jgi:hypothetical protein
MNKLLMSLYLACALVMAPLTALAGQEDIKIDVQDVELKSTKVKRQFNAYKITVSNNSKNTVRILNGTVQNGTTSTGAYSALDLDHSGVGMAWAIGIPLSLVTFGGGMLGALLMTPYYIITNNNAKREVGMMTSKFKDQVVYVGIPPLQSFSFATLVNQPKKPVLKSQLAKYNFQKPAVQLTIEDQATKQTFTVDNKPKT